MKDILDQINNASIKLLSPADPDNVYKIIVHEAMRLVNSDFGSIFFLKDNELQRAYASSKKLYAVKPRKNGYIYNALKSKSSAFLEIDQINHIHPKLKSIGIKSIMVVPLLYQKKSIGVLTVQSTRPNHFNNKSLDILKLFGSMSTFAIKKSQLYAETKEAIEMRDHFISIAAHELKTPLTAINGYAQLLFKKNNDPTSTEWKWINSLIRQSIKLSHSINELLEVNKIQRGKSEYNFVECSLTEIIDMGISVFKKTYPDRVITVNQKLDKSSDTVVGDCNKLLQAIISLLDNAAKFSPPHSHVEITIGKKSNQLYFQIKDEGVGIEPDDLKKIFKGLYKKSNDSVKGMGLGLFLSRNIISHHHGDMKIKSKVNQGTTIMIKLPSYHTYGKH